MGHQLFYDLGLHIGTEVGFIRVRIRTTRVFPKFFDLIRGGHKGGSRITKSCMASVFFVEITNQVF